MEMLTGQIITRPMGKAPDGKREIVVIYGIVAVDKDSPLKKEGMQFVVAGRSDFDETTMRLPINVMQAGQIDRSELTRGNTPDCMLTEVIWRS